MYTVLFWYDVNAVYDINDISPCSEEYSHNDIRFFFGAFVSKIDFIVNIPFE